jgi:putative inorganic carbon (HCO3(-)) transporter
MLRTGSRGSELAAVSVAVLAFFLTRQKLKMAVLTVAVVAVGLLAAPSAALHRLTLLTTDEAPQSIDDVGAIASGLQRTELFMKSLKLTLANPLFGVGPGQFANAVAGEAARDGKWEAWLGTHNSYTQVSSECGIPALLVYITIIVWNFRLNYRLYKRTVDNPALREIAGLSFCLLAATLVYAVGTTFFHMAYTSQLATLTGLSVALYLSTKSMLGPAHGTQSAPSPIQAAPLRSLG